ncbi:hypothetical protein [Candidatus Lokiarchaeum ossiferum]|uniref:hypothetical protein n=1 Tax=Candidatus Lokiarchaeum ossiferum TaxID=2951803 RepID=UPI00352C5168
MAKGTNPAGSIIASVLITLIISGAGMYFGLPLLFPNMNHEFVEPSDLDEYAQVSELEDDGIVVQSRYMESKENAFITDNDLTPTKMPGTEMNFTTQGSTKLAVSFEATILFHMSSDFSISTKYNMTLSINGVQNKSTRLSYYSSSPLGDTTEFVENVHIEFESGTLPAGTYTINVYWYSLLDASFGTTQLVAATSSYQYPRSIYVQELKV